MNDSSTKTNDSSSNKAAPSDRGAEELKSAVVAGAHDVKDGISDLTHQVVEQTKKGTESQLTYGKERAADGLRDVAKALRSASEQLRADENEALTGYIDRAAGKVSDVSDYLKDHSLSELSTEVKTFARREPALFLGGALVLGLIGGRFLKSSTPESGSSGSGGGQSRVGGASQPRSPMRSAQLTGNTQPFPPTSRSGSLGAGPKNGPGVA